MGVAIGKARVFLIVNIDLILVVVTNISATCYSLKIQVVQSPALKSKYVGCNVTLLHDGSFFYAYSSLIEQSQLNGR